MRRLAILCALAAWLWPLAAAADVVLAPGQPLEQGLVEGLVREALVAQGIGAAVTVSIDRPDLPLANRAQRPIMLKVAGLRRDRATGRYEARIAATLPDGEGSTIMVAGIAQELVAVVVPTRPVAPGEMLTAADLALRQVPEAQLQPDTLTDPADAVGLEARRALPAGRMIRGREVAAPVLVRRGEPVTVVYATGRLEITTAGTALAAGRRGEPIQVQNSASGEVRRGIVAGVRRVRIEGAGVQP